MFSALLVVGNKTNEYKYNRLTLANIQEINTKLRVPILNAVRLSLADCPDEQTAQALMAGAVRECATISFMSRDWRKLSVSPEGSAAILSTILGISQEVAYQIAINEVNSAELEAVVFHATGKDTPGLNQQQPDNPTTMDMRPTIGPDAG